MIMIMWLFGLVYLALGTATLEAKGDISIVPLVVGTAMMFTALALKQIEGKIKDILRRLGADDEPK